MPRFSESGADMYICQSCGRDLPSDTQPPTWMKVPGYGHTGNVCPECRVKENKQAQRNVQAINDEMNGKPPMSLREYCHEESGGLTGAALDRYINRYYGHG